MNWGQALSDLFKSITCLPTDTTLISLAPGPLLELVCLAAERQLTASWLSLAAILIAQLNPPPPLLMSGGGSGVGTRSGTATGEAETIVMGALPMLLNCSLGVLGVPGVMENVSVGLCICCARVLRLELVI